MSAQPGRMWVRDPQVQHPGLADLERRHLPADGPPRPDRTGHRPWPGRHRRGAVRRPRPGPQCRRVLDRAAHRRGHPHRHPACPWEDRTLVKTFGPRGTVHLLPTADLPMWTGALSALPSSVPAHPEPVRFSAEQAEEVIAAIGDALADTELTVDELTEQIVDRTGPWAGEPTMEAFGGRWPRWRQLTSMAAHRGLLCFGPNRGPKVTYTNPHRWLPGFRPDDGDAALRSLVIRYLYAYGPATPQHLARWLAIPPPPAVELFGVLAGELEQVEVDGASGWTVAGDTATPPEPHRGLRLLGYFDAFVVASQPRERLYPGPAATRALTPGGQAGNYPVLLVDGVVGGVWHQRRSGHRLAITVEPLGELTATQRRQLEDEVDLVGAVLEATPMLTVGTVTVGPHA